MRHSSLEIHNRWAGYLESPGFGELLTLAGKGVGRLLKSEVVLKCSLDGMVTCHELMDLASASALSTVLTHKNSRVVVSPSMFLCSKILHAAAGSDRLAVYPCFQKAAIELFLLNMVSAVEPRLSGARIHHDIGTMKLASSSGEACYARIAVDFYAGEFIGSADAYPIGFEPALRRLDDECHPRPLEGRILISTASLTPEVLGGLMPGDVVNTGVSDGGFEGTLVIFNNDERQMECQVRFSNYGEDEVNITGNFKEVKIMEAEMEGSPDSGENKKYPRMENLRLPVRFEVGAVTISPGQFLALTPGQVLHVDGGGMMQAKMTVCGSIFAEGKIERFEDFYGFRIERLC